MKMHILLLKGRIKTKRSSLDNCGKYSIFPGKPSVAARCGVGEDAQTCSCSVKPLAAECYTCCWSSQMPNPSS